MGRPDGGVDGLSLPQRPRDWLLRGPMQCQQLSAVGVCVRVCESV